MFIGEILYLQFKPEFLGGVNKRNGIEDPIFLGFLREDIFDLLQGYLKA